MLDGRSSCQRSGNSEKIASITSHVCEQIRSGGDPTLNLREPPVRGGFRYRGGSGHPSRTGLIELQRRPFGPAPSRTVRGFLLRVACRSWRLAWTWPTFLAPLWPDLTDLARPPRLPALAGSSKPASPGAAFDGSDRPRFRDRCHTEMPSCRGRSRSVSTATTDRHANRRRLPCMPSRDDPGRPDVPFAPDVRHPDEVPKIGAGSERSSAPSARGPRPSRWLP